MPRHALTGALAFACACLSAHAEEHARCVDLAIPKGAIEARDGKWIALADAQYRFIEGVYALNPQTPPGLPYGDRAILAQTKSSDGGMIFFVDGERACTPMPIPKELIEMLSDIGAGIVSHEPSN